MRIGTPGYSVFHFDAALVQAAALGDSQPVKVMISAYRWASGSPRDRLVMGHAVSQGAKILQLEGDVFPLDVGSLENRPQMLPEVVAVPAEKRTPESEVQLGHHRGCRPCDCAPAGRAPWSRNPAGSGAVGPGHHPSIPEHRPPSARGRRHCGAPPRTYVRGRTPKRPRTQRRDTSRGAQGDLRGRRGHAALRRATGLCRAHASRKMGTLLLELRSAFAVVSSSRRPAHLCFTIAL